MFDRLTPHNKAVSIARRLHVAKPLKEAYFRLKAPSDRICHSRLYGVEVRFFAPTAGEWRKLEQLSDGQAEGFLEILISYLSPGQVFYDVGSNVGEYAIFLAKRVGPEGTVAAIEPVKSSYERTQDNIRVNGFANIRAYQTALSDRPGVANLKIGGFLSRQSRLVDQPSDDECFETVRVTTGDLLRKTEGLPVPDAVKIDVEGHEYQVLRGMRETLLHPACRLLCCEVHPMHLPAPITPGEVTQAIRSFGFSSIETIPRGSEIHLVCNKRGPIRATA